MELSIIFGMTSFWLIVVGAVILLVAIGILAYYLRRKKQRGPEGADAALVKTLTAYATQRKNTTLVSHPKGMEGGADHLLVGPFGIVFVCGIVETTAIYGEPRSTHWRVRKNKQIVEFPNPLLVMEQEMELLRGHFSKEDVHGIPMEPVVVFTSPDTLELMLTGVTQAVQLKTLQQYLTKHKRLAVDKEINLPQLVELVQKIVL